MLGEKKNKTLSHDFGIGQFKPIKSAQPRRQATGFTLIELLASITVIALISGVFMVNYHNTSKRSELKVSAQKLASNIRLAQNYSLGSKTYNGTATPAGGWGVRVALSSPSNYIIFADLDSDQSYDAGEAMETKTLPAGVTINSLAPANAVDIIFFPPNPDIYINGDDVFSNPANTAVIVIKENINNSTATVTVNYFGLIDAQ